MKQITLVALLLSALIGYGQDNTIDQATSKFRRFQIGLTISPDICYRTIKKVGDLSFAGDIVKSRNQIEKVKLGYTLGFNVCYKLKKLVSLESGLHYSNKGYQTKVDDVVYAQPSASLPTAVRLIYDFHYLDIPLKINFIIGKRKVRFISSIGLTTNIFIQGTQRSVVYYSNKTERESNPLTYNFNRINLSPTMSLGIDYKISNRMNLRIEPTFRYGVLKIFDAPLPDWLYNAGLNIGYYVEI